MLLLASQLLIRKLSETQYSKYQSTHWQVAIDASFLWIKLSNGHFSQIPLKDITDAYFTEDALVVNHFPNMSFVISDKEFTDPEYRSRATQYLTDAQKLKTLTPIGMLAQKQTSPQNQS